MAKPPSDQAEKIVVRLPDGMRDRLAEVAKANGRSVNAEVVLRLELSLEPDDDSLVPKTLASSVKKEIQAMDDRVRQIEDAFARLKSGVDYIYDEKDMKGE